MSDSPGTDKYSGESYERFRELKVEFFEKVRFFEILGVK
jgi:hypothetical protein